MGLSIGIVGLPNVGKSTLLNALSRAGAAVTAYAFATKDSATGIAQVPDHRLQRLAQLFQTRSQVPATVTFVDIAGLVPGAARGEGLGNRFLGHIRECDAMVMVVRCFEDPGVTHVSGALDPRQDVEIVNAELMLADLEALERRKGRTAKQAHRERSATGEAALLERVEVALGRGTPVRAMGLSDEERLLLRDLSLLTLKPVLYVANVSESEATAESGPCMDEVAALAVAEGARWLAVSARIEAELQELDGDEAAQYRESMGLAESGLGRLARAAYEELGLITFFTAESKECRAWTIRRGTRAPQAAATIHTDFERGFIKAEVIGWDELVEAGSWPAARGVGKVRLEGKDYVFQDGDTTIFRFNV